MSLRGLGRRVASVGILCGASFVSAQICLQFASAQVQTVSDPSGFVEAHFVPQDRQLRNLLDRARSQLNEPTGDRQLGLELVQQILDKADDYFSDRELTESLRRDAEALLAELPEDVQQLYEETYGAEARALLSAAIESDDTRLHNVIRRFGFTKAGREAAFMRAATEMDRGQFLLSARLFERLLKQPRAGLPSREVIWQRAISAYWKAGFPEVSQDLFLSELRESPPAASWRGQPLPQFSGEDQAVVWLQQQMGDAGRPVGQAAGRWLMEGGAADRNASVTKVSPIFDNAWTMPLLSEADATSSDRLNELQTALKSVNTSVLGGEQPTAFPVAEPLIIGDKVVISSFGRIKAADARTGRFCWQAADADPAFEHLSYNLKSVHGASAGNGLSPLDDFFAQRAWLDATSSSLSSDNLRVFEVFDCGLVLPQQTYDLSASSQGPLGSPTYNRLRAYDVKTEGKLLWEVGGPPGRVSLPLAGTFFLGAPLPLDGSLYVIGEERGQIRLNVLSPETGEILWSLALLNTSEDIGEDVERRFSGLSPSYAGGILICPTGGGLVVGVDPTMRSLLWAHSYAEPQAARAENVLRGRIPPFNDPSQELPSTSQLLGTSRWHGPSTVIAGEYVLHCPPDDEAVHCMKLLDGQPVWSRSRERFIYQAGVHGDAMILVGERHVEAAKLKTGETIWSLPLETPSGRGVRDGHLYRLPLRGGEVATIDLNEGQLLARSCSRTGAELGNLVAANGRLFTQTATELRGFRSVSELESQIAADLAANPRDPAALAVRGEMRLHDGDTENALADLRISYETAPDARVRKLMADTLLERLRENFALHRETIPELERLVNEVDRQIRLVRTIAEGLEAGGELEAAYGRYLELLALDDLDAMREHPANDRTVRLDRWVMGRLQRIYELTPEDERSGIDQQTRDFITSAIEAETTNLLMRSAVGFTWHPAGILAREGWADAIDPQQYPLRAEALWLRLRDDGTQTHRADAVAKLVQLYADNERDELAADLLRELENQHAATKLEDGRSGSEVATALRKKTTVEAALAHVIDWPTESIRIRKSEEGSQRQQAVPLRTTGAADPLFASSSFAFDNRGEVTAYDGYGRPDWSVQVPTRTGYGFPESHYVERRGHRAVVFLSNQFRLLNMIQFGQRPQTIIEDELLEAPLQDALGRRVTGMRLHRMGLRTFWRSEDGADSYLGNVGPIRDEHLCYQQGHTLFVVDPYSGEELWHVEGLPPGCEIVADELYIVLIPPEPANDRQVAHVFQVSDGTFLRARPLPSNIERSREGADWGRMFLTKTPHPGTGDMTLAMFDPVHGENVWERTISDFHSWAPLDGEDLVVLDEAGRIQLIEATSGETLFEKSTEISPKVNSITVMSHPHEWFVFTKQRPNEQQQSRLILPRNRSDTHAVNGLAYAFDRSTRDKLWKREILSLLVDPSLPQRWPLLVLSADAWVLGNQARGRATNRFQNLLVLNKRTGEVLFEGDGTGQWQGTTWGLSDGKPQLHLSFGRTGLAVTFDDVASAEKQDAPDSPSSEPSKTESEPTRKSQPPTPPRKEVPATPSLIPPEGIEM